MVILGPFLSCLQVVVDYNPNAQFQSSLGQDNILYKQAFFYSTLTNFFSAFLPTLYFVVFKLFPNLQFEIPDSSPQMVNNL